MIMGDIDLFSLHETDLAVRRHKSRIDMPPIQLDGRRRLREIRHHPGTHRFDETVAENDPSIRDHRRRHGVDRPSDQQDGIRLWRCRHLS